MKYTSLGKTARALRGLSHVHAPSTILPLPRRAFVGLLHVFNLRDNVHKALRPNACLNDTQLLLFPGLFLLPSQSTFQAHLNQPFSA
jgi:hypothetical protein